MDAANMVRHYQACMEAGRLLKEVTEKALTQRPGYDKILQVARTIADLEAADLIETHHMAEAIQYRSLDRKMS
jgi:magnesium chelatase family protein